MVLPIPCDVDESLSLTCFYTGSIVPTRCPNGTLCGTPFMRPLPAPPGFAQSEEVVTTSAYKAKSTPLASVQQLSAPAPALTNEPINERGSSPLKYDQRVVWTIGSAGVSCYATCELIGFCSESSFPGSVTEGIDIIFNTPALRGYSASCDNGGYDPCDAAGVTL